MLSMKGARSTIMIFVISLVFITLAAMVVSLLSVAFPISYAYYDNLKIVSDKIQYWLVKPVFSLVRISSDTGNTMTNMMNQVPQNVIIKVKSSQIIPVGKESQIALLILDKNTGKPMTGAQVVIGIERGASMSTMDMVGGSMFDAKEREKTSGLYLFGFTPDSKGYYTMHTHVIPPGESMDSMMDNHLDIGLIAK
ncbi:MAG TPA: hypothetical protein VJ729_00680 [Nitrososphaeraceae archaeon]|nr:hypothetical protein [Nitrososphaeraceae archaeon]